MPSLSDYEEFDFNVLEIDNVSWSGNKLRANFGHGYAAIAVTGNAGGLHRWTVSSGMLPDDESYGNLVGESDDETRFGYVFDFFKRHTTGDQDVFIVDFRGRKYFAEFAENSWSAAMESIDVFSMESIEIKQRRVAGFSYNSDGSIDTTPPSVPTDFAVTGADELSLDLDWTASTD